MSVIRDTSHVSIAPCGLLKHSPFGDNLRHVSTALLSWSLECGENARVGGVVHLSSNYQGRCNERVPMWGQGQCKTWFNAETLNSRTHRYTYLAKCRKISRDIGSKYATGEKSASVDHVIYSRVLAEQICTHSSRCIHCSAVTMCLCEATTYHDFCAFQSWMYFFWEYHSNDTFEIQRQDSNLRFYGRTNQIFWTQHFCIDFFCSGSCSCSHYHFASIKKFKPQIVSFGSRNKICGITGKPVKDVAFLWEFSSAYRYELACHGLVVWSSAQLQL